MRDNVAFVYGFNLSVRGNLGQGSVRGGPHPLDRFASQLRWNPGS